MDTTNSSENPQRRVEDRKPAEVIDWAAPGAPAVPLSPAATSGDAPADEQWMFDLAAEYESRGAGLYGPVTFTAQQLPNFVQAVIARIERAATPATASGDELPELPAFLEIDWPTLNRVALGCGVEDRNLTDRYDAAEYGWQVGMDDAAERVPEDIYDEATVKQIQREAYELGKARAAVSAATKPIADSELEFNATRLRNVAKLVGLEKSIPEDDATLDGARGSVLGLIAGALRNAATKPPAELSASGLLKLWKQAEETATDTMPAPFQFARSLLATKPAAPTDRNDILEEAANLCEEIEGDMFDQYKGRGKHEPNNPYRADPYMNGQSDGAGQCAISIRKLMRNPAATPAASTTGAAQTAEQVREAIAASRRAGTLINEGTTAAPASAGQAAPAMIEQYDGPWPTVEMTVAGKRMLEKQTSIEHIKKYSAGIANSIYEAMHAVSPVGIAAQPAEGAGQAGQVAMTADELAALRRFYECAADGEGYDVPKPMMRRLSEIGVVQRTSGAYYRTTEYGLAVLESAERAAAPADQPSAQVKP